MYKPYRTRTDQEWYDLKDQARARSEGRCEYCGDGLAGGGDLHHRWYTPTEPDTLEQLMIVHRACHSAIHRGGKILAFPWSLCGRGDRGKKYTIIWRQYLQKNT